MKTFLELKKNLKKNFSGLRIIRIALLGDSATQFLTQAIRGTGFDERFDLQIWEADFNQIDHQIADPDSELYKENPDVVILFQSSHKLLSKYNKLAVEQQRDLAESQLQWIDNINNTLNARLQAKVIFFNYAEINDAVFGSYASKVESSFLYQLRKLNFKLMDYAMVRANFHLFDLSSIQNRLGNNNLFKPSIYINTEMVLSLDVLPDAASKLVNMISAMYGSIKKCLILDLDNVLWGGIIGDDGLENIQIGGLGIGKAFTELQWWVKKLRSRGIILAVCSKNSESVARQPFEKHPDMVLRLEDIAVFVANWGLKSDNIRHIQRVLNISFESMVFLDDNPFERNLVKESIPEITVPELPEDPADYLEFLYSLNLFETNSFTEEDKERTKLYQVESRRIAIRESFSDAAEFLKSLHMLSEVERFNKFNAPRVAQLSQRSNQFNLRTVRYGEEDIEKILHSDIYFTFAFSLKDNLGDHGLIAVVVLQKKSEDTLFIESWFMSCRVLKRGMEEFTLNSIVNFANANKFKNLVGEYIPTAKNEIVRNHYNDLGFEAKDGLWFLPVNDYKDKICYILEK